jgi:hypothetical protein
MSNFTTGVSLGIPTFGQEHSLSLSTDRQQTRKSAIVTQDISLLDQHFVIHIRERASINSLSGDLVRLISHYLPVSNYVALTQVARNFRFLGSKESLALYVEGDAFLTIKEYRKIAAPRDSMLVKLLSVLPFVGCIANCITGLRVRSPEETEAACHAYNWRLSRLTEAKQKIIIAQEALRSKIKVLKIRARHFTLAGLSGLTGLVGTQILLWHPATRPPLTFDHIAVNVVTGVVIFVFFTVVMCGAGNDDRDEAAEAQLELDDLPTQDFVSSHQEADACADSSLEHLEQKLSRLEIQDEKKS